MVDDRAMRAECDAAFDRLWRLYGDRVGPEKREELREAVGAVVKTVAALMAVKLENGTAPLAPFTPFRGRE